MAPSSASVLSTIGTANVLFTSPGVLTASSAFFAAALTPGRLGFVNSSVTSPSRAAISLRPSANARSLTGASEGGGDIGMFAAGGMATGPDIGLPAGAGVRSGTAAVPPVSPCTKPAKSPPCAVSASSESDRANLAAIVPLRSDLESVGHIITANIPSNPTAANTFSAPRQPCRIPEEIDASTIAANATTSRITHPPLFQISA